MQIPSFMFVLTVGKEEQGQPAPQRRDLLSQLLCVPLVYGACLTALLMLKNDDSAQAEALMMLTSIPAVMFS